MKTCRTDLNTVVGHALACQDWCVPHGALVARTFVSAASRFVSTLFRTAGEFRTAARKRPDDSGRCRHECPGHVGAFLLLAATAFAQIPTPESVLGHKPGDDFYLATYEDSLGYFRKLAASSNRIKLVNVGKTTRGRDWFIAFISDPANLAQLDHYKDVSRRLAVARGISDEQAHDLARETRPIIHIDGGLHADEVANHQHTIQLGYDLVTAETAEIKAIRQNLIVELWFSINPDGQSAVAEWYRQNVGTPYEVSPMPDLYQEYVRSEEHT